MERRAAIQSLVIISAGLIVFPSCQSNSGKSSISLKNIKINAAEEKLLADIASTIIPATDTPGAKETGAHLFALKMLDDMHEKEVQKNFMYGLREFVAEATKQFNRSFTGCTTEQKQKLLLDIENKKGDFPEIIDFYTIMKQRTVQGYLNSKYVMTNIIKYELIPTHKYDGYYPVENL